MPPRYTLLKSAENLYGAGREQSGPRRRRESTDSEVETRNGRATSRDQQPQYNREEDAAPNSRDHEARNSERSTNQRTDRRSITNGYPNSPDYGLPRRTLTFQDSFDQFHGGSDGSRGQSGNYRERSSSRNHQQDYNPDYQFTHQRNGEQLQQFRYNMQPDPYNSERHTQGGSGRRNRHEAHGSNGVVSGIRNNPYLAHIPSNHDSDSSYSSNGRSSRSNTINSSESGRGSGETSTVVHTGGSLSRRHTPNPEPIVNNRHNVPSGSGQEIEMVIIGLTSPHAIHAPGLTYEPFVIDLEGDQQQQQQHDHHHSHPHSQQRQQQEDQSRSQHRMPSRRN